MRSFSSVFPKSRNVLAAAISLLILIPLTVLAGWIRTYGEAGKVLTGSVVNQTSDDGYIVIGGIYPKDSFPGNGPFLVLKVDSLGHKQWSKSYTKGVNELGWGDQQTGDGGYLLFSNSAVPDSMYASIWLLKTDSAGDTLWTRTFGRDTVGYDVVKCSDGSYAIAGAGRGNMLFMKIDSLGNTLRIDTLGYGRACCVRETSDNGFILAGYKLDYDSGYYIAVVRLNTQGGVVWERYFNWGSSDSTGFYYALANAVDESSDGGFVVAGYADYMTATASSADSAGLVVFKLDSAGELLWFRNDLDCSEAVVCEEDGSCVVSGLGMAKLDSQGNTLWSQPRGQTGLKKTSDNGYITTGWQGTELFLCKTDSLGLLGVSEPSPEPPVTPQPSSEMPVTHLEISSPIGSEITLCFSNCAEGFRAQVFDASGRRIDEIRSPHTQGTIRWGGGRTGVYFIVAEGLKADPRKVILVK